ncbi:hypothetical protein HG531_009775 [Fusarium graminearum]|nr:hypothetical protein HG531_009775 [Fusarium graminearum]
MIIREGSLSLGGIAVAGNLGSDIVASSLGLGLPKLGLVLLPLLARDRVGVELAFVGNDDLLARLTSNNTSITPVEIVHVPERVKRQTEGEDGNGSNIHDHPTNHLPLAAQDEDNGLQTVDGTKQQEGCDGHDGGVGRDLVNQVDDIHDNDRLDNSTQEIDENDESHTETTETTKFGKRDKLDQVVHSRVNPTTSLRQEDGPRVGSNGPSLRAVEVLCLVLAVVLEEQSRKVSILTKVKQVLHVKGWVDADNIADLVVHLELHGAHGEVIVNTVEEAHENHLRVSLTTVTGTSDFRRLANLDNDHEGDNVTLDFVETRVDLTHVVLLHTLTKSLEAEGFGVNSLRDTKNIKDNARRRPVVTLTDNHTVTNNDKELALIIVLHAGKRIDSTAQRVLVFGISGNHTHDELVEVLGNVLATELKRGKELEDQDRSKQNRDGQNEVLGELTTSRVSSIRITNVEEVVQAGLHTLLLDCAELDVVPVLGNILTLSTSEELDNTVLHKVGSTGNVGCRLTGLSLHAKTALHVLGHIIDLSVDGDNVPGAVAGELLDILGSVTHSALEVDMLKGVHLLKVPIRSAVVGTISEIVVDGVDVDISLRKKLRLASHVGVSVVESNLGRNGTILTLAKSRDLDGEERRNVLSSVLHESSFADKVATRIMVGDEVLKINDESANGNIGTFAALLTVVRRELTRTVHILLGANEHGESDHEEGGNSTHQPNEHVDSNLFSPGHSNILTGHASDYSDGKIGDEPGEEVNESNPTLSAGLISVLFNFFKGETVASIRRVQAAVSATNRNGFAELGNLHPAALTEEDTSSTHTDFILRPLLLLNDHLSTLTFTAHQNCLRICQAKELAERQEQTEVGRSEALADFCNTKAPPGPLAVGVCGQCWVDQRGSLHYGCAFGGMSDGLKSILAEKASNKLALGTVDHVEEITRDDFAVLLDKSLDRVVNLTSKVLDSEASRSVLSQEVATWQLGLGRADLNSSVLAIEASSEGLEKLHVRSVASGLVVEDAEETVARLQDTSNSIRVVEVAGSSDTDLLRLQHISLAVEKVLKSQVVDALSSSIVKKLVEGRSGGSLLAETGEIDDRDSVSNRLLGGTKALVNGLENPGNKKRVQCSCKLSSVGASTVGVKHDGDTFSVNHLGLVTQSSLKVGRADTKEGRNNAEDILVLHGCDSSTTLVRETTTVITSNAGLASCLKLKLANVKNTGENLADLSDLGTGELELSESILEDLETLGIIDANLELSRVAKILPTLLSGASSPRATIQTKMRLLGLACTSKKIVQNVEVSLSCWDIGDTASLQTMVEKLTTDQDGVGGS